MSLFVLVLPFGMGFFLMLLLFMLFILMLFFGMHIFGMLFMTMFMNQAVEVLGFSPDGSRSNLRLNREAAAIL